MKYAIPAIKATIVLGLVASIALYAVYGMNSNPATESAAVTPDALFAGPPAPKHEAPLPHAVISTRPQHASGTVRGVVKSIQSVDAVGNGLLVVGTTPVQITGNNGSEPTWLHEDGIAKLTGKTVWVLGHREQGTLVAWMLVVEKTP